MTKNELKNKKIIVALSGGPDSVFLIYWLIKKIKIDSKNVIACHVNYNYRKDSNNDVKVCKKLCINLNIKLLIKDIETDYSKLKENFEAWARKERYKFFVEVLKEKKFDLILTGHNLNDSVESFIIQKLRKTNTDYFGIRRETTINGALVYRPLLNIRKEKIKNIIDKLVKKEKIIEPVFDITNNDTSFLRNKIRKNIKNDFSIKLKELKVSQKRLQKILKNNKKVSIKQEFLNINELLEIKDINIQKNVLFEFLKEHKSVQPFLNKKKDRLTELLKLSKSRKPFVTLEFDQKIFIKDKNKLYILDDLYFPFENKKLEQLIHFKNFDLIKSSVVKNKIITNNWLKYGNFLVENYDITLKEVYKSAKIAYIKRYEYLFLVDNITEKIQVFIYKW